MEDGLPCAYTKNSNGKGDALVSPEDALERVGPESGAYKYAVERADGVCEYTGEALLGAGKWEVDHKVELDTFRTLMACAGQSFAPKGWYLPWSEAGVDFIHRHMNDPGNLVCVNSVAHHEKTALGCRYSLHLRRALAAGEEELTGVMAWYSRRQVRRANEGKHLARLLPSFSYSHAHHHQVVAMGMHRELYTLKKTNDRLLCAWVTRALGCMGGISLPMPNMPEAEVAVALEAALVPAPAPPGG
jgi:hypothetical protein